MKPIVFYIKESNQKDGKIILSKDEFESMLEQAYQQGRSDGANQIVIPYTSPNTPLTPSTPITPIFTCKSSTNEDQVTGALSTKEL